MLGGLTPAQNRDIPPLTPEKGERLKLRYPQLQVIINGGITDTATASAYLDWADGVMIGRAAYHQPRFLSELERLMFGRSDTPDEHAIVGRYIDYMAEQMQAGVKLNALTKHLLHSFNGRRGARRFRQILSDANRLRANDLSLVEEALEPLGLAG